MKDKNHIIAPIAIDFGAKKTGIYYAKYPKSIRYTDIKKKGKISGQELEYKHYTLLLKDRTSHRHSRRRYDRLQFAKRLIMLILTKYFQFPAEKHTQAIGFLMNRRGFTRIDGDFNREYFKTFPKKAWDELPKAVQEKLKQENPQDSVNILNSFDQLTNAPEMDDLKSVCEELKDKNKKIKADLVYYSYADKIKKSAKKRIKGETLNETKKEKNKLSQTNKWIIEKLVNDGASSLNGLCSNKNDCNLLDFINNLDKNSSDLKQLSQLSFDEKKQSVKNSIWNFNIENFNLTKEEENSSFDSEDDLKTHLHHLCYAVYKVYDERTSGSIHRSKFFEEIKKLLNGEKNCKHKYFKKFLSAIDDDSQRLNREDIFKLIGHISNFELKPLRAYFNDLDYKTGDKWDNQKLSKIFSRWCLKLWRVTEDKDGNKKVCDYNTLKKLWQKQTNKDNVIDFWLKTDPALTIPPYQSMTNRHPPKCQTLLLNKKFMDQHYPHWRKWLQELKSSAEGFNGSAPGNIHKFSKKTQQSVEYAEELQQLKNKKDKPLISPDEIELRSLQFILDRSQKIDPFQSNKIWSLYHKINQLKNRMDEERKKELGEYESQLDKSKRESKLPDDLKDDLTFDKQGSFGHFLNKYYKNRKKAREGRYFLHQKKKNKWEDKNKLLTVCRHKPRQKKYQMLADLGSIFGLSSSEAKEKIQREIDANHRERRFGKNKKTANSDHSQEIEDCGERSKEFLNQNKNKEDHSEQIKQWFIQLAEKEIRLVCSTASNMQKKHKGDLKRKINSLEQQAEKNPTTNFQFEDDKKLYKAVSNCKELAHKIAKNLWPTEAEQRQKAEKFSSVFSFAQIHNIVFKDRSSFSNTCPICSIDNGLRTWQTHQAVAMASRLSGLKIRVIDGAVRRICDSLSTKISDTLWSGIKSHLSEGSQITIPLILEQNRFEFEPSLKELKGKGKQSTNDDSDNEWKNRENRIKSDKVCPYSGNAIGDNGEMDHIIPRTSQYGELNDEANLIYASKAGNQKKGNRLYSLDDLNEEYKKEVLKPLMDSVSYEEIKKFIYNQLEKNSNEVEEGNDFKFGKYMNFSNLEPYPQKAFRHALFLKEDDPLKKKVIQAIQNRNKTIVNGTQRYLAQCIADKIREKAKAEQKENSITFDYFEYPSDAHHPKSIYNLRKYYEQFSESLKKLSKETNKPQKPGSHIVDAQMAFLQAVDDHKNNGTMGLNFHQGESIRQGFDKPDKSLDKEVRHLKVYDATKPDHLDLEYIELNRKQSKKGYRFHRSFHRAGFYAKHYVPIILSKENNKYNLKAGFSLKNSVELKTAEQKFSSCLSFIKNQKVLDWLEENKFEANKKDLKGPEEQANKQWLEKLHHFLEKLFPKQKQYFYLNWDKQKIHQYLVQKFSSMDISKGELWDEKVEFLSSLSYKTKKKSITEKTIKEMTEKNQNFEIEIKNKNLTLPIKKDWEKLLKSWEQKQEEKSDSKFDDFLKEYFKIKNNKHPHQKARKVFSLPVKDEQCHYLQKRKSWNNKPIYQICADSESRKDNNKFHRNVLYKDNSKTELKISANKPFVSHDIFLLKKKENQEVSNNYRNIDPQKWFSISKEAVKQAKQTWPEGVSQIQYKISAFKKHRYNPDVKLTLETETLSLKK